MFSSSNPKRKGCGQTRLDGVDQWSELECCFGTTSTPTINASGQSVQLCLPLTVLGNVSAIRWRMAQGTIRSIRHGWICESENWMHGAMVAPKGMPLKDASHELYQTLLAELQDRALYRVWNYVPEINVKSEGLENYQQFCMGRSQAFEHIYGQTSASRMSAASAVGSPRGPLAMAFLAGRYPANNFENPQQIPAWRYPERYGPRPPSFARATTVRIPQGDAWFVSGTASIRGSDSFHPGEIIPQMELTLENLRHLSDRLDLQDLLSRKTLMGRQVQVYLRNAADYPCAREYLESHFLSPHDTVLYLHAPICRADLEFEMECALMPVSAK